MDRLDAEMILLRWDDASDDEKRAATVFGLANLREYLDLLETDLPDLATAAASGDFDPREVTHQQAAHDVGLALQQWIKMCPEPMLPWHDIGTRAKSVKAAYDALRDERTGYVTALKESPLAALAASVAAELESGAIPCACPHPVTADRLSLPSRILRCHDCDAEAGDCPDSSPGTCASCGIAGAGVYSVILVGAVLVIARICVPCGTAGTTPADPGTLPGGSSPS